jgi:hypothetical protein
MQATWSGVDETGVFKPFAKGAGISYAPHCQCADLRELLLLLLLEGCTGSGDSPCTSGALSLEAGCRQLWLSSWGIRG